LGTRRASPLGIARSATTARACSSSCSSKPAPTPREGTDDPIVPVVNGRILASRLPDARLEVVACGHLFILTRPDQTAATIERFMIEELATEAA
jgi:hypothetical protein